MVNVYEDGEIIATVKYNQNLDIWDGSNWQNGGTGRHLGITAIQKSEEEKHYVLIHGSDWQGDSDYAEIISENDAFQVIMKYSPELLEDEKFKDLNKFKEDLFVEVE